VKEDLDRRSALYQFVKFREIPNKFIEEEGKKYSELLNEDKKDEDTKLSSFEKKFKFERGEKLQDSFTCAISKKILLHGRLYITNKRLCFYSMFNNKLLFFGKDTKISIPLEDIRSLEKRINALVFDNSIAVITKINKETFLTSFLQRDKAFQVIRGVIEKELGVQSFKLNSRMQRTFVRLENEETKGNIFILKW